MKELKQLQIAKEVLESIAALDCKPAFETVLIKLTRVDLISVVETDIALAREALLQMESV